MMISGTGTDEDGTPLINGKRAIKCDREGCLHPLFPSLCEWRCPECGSHLTFRAKVCLNGCHLSAAAERRFQAGLMTCASKE